jgi:hypothetical protein
MAQGTSVMPDTPSVSDDKTEIEGLRKLALQICGYLAITMVATLFAGAFTLQRSGEMVRLTAEALIGACGSAVAALTSCLDRFANGFELETGKKVPPASKDERKETFNRRMARWFVFRPMLGLVVAPIFIWGIEYFASEPAKFTGSPSRLGFSAFMGGLLAKSVIDLIKGLFKNIFKV